MSISAAIICTLIILLPILAFGIALIAVANLFKNKENDRYDTRR